MDNKNIPSPGYHPLRAVGSLIAGVVFAIGAWFTLRYRGTESEAGARTGAGAGTGRRGGNSGTVTK